MNISFEEKRALADLAGSLQKLIYLTALCEDEVESIAAGREKGDLNARKHDLGSLYQERIQILDRMGAIFYKHQTSLDAVCERIKDSNITPESRDIWAAMIASHGSGRLLALNVTKTPSTIRAEIRTRFAETEPEDDTDEPAKTDGQDDPGGPGGSSGGGTGGGSGEVGGGVGGGGGGGSAGPVRATRLDCLGMVGIAIGLGLMYPLLPPAAYLAAMAASAAGAVCGRSPFAGK
jgi:hypothetical protein